MQGLDGKHYKNISCKNCNYRHPVEWSCEESKKVADIFKCSRGVYPNGFLPCPVDLNLKVGELPKVRQIIHPVEGWKEKTYYKVEISVGRTTPIFPALFYSEFLNGQKGGPGGYSAFVHPNLNSNYKLEDLYYCKVICEVLDENFELLKKPQIEPSTPEIFSLWKHYNGVFYRVIGIANEEPNSKKYPKSIVYQNVGNGKVYCRAFSDWHRSMSFVK